MNANRGFGIDIEAAKRRLRERMDIRARRNQRRYEAACRDASAIIRWVVEKYNPKRVFQWGSLLDKEKFTSRSDIDIALEGVDSAADMFEIYGAAMEMTDFRVDIVQMEKIEPEFADLIRVKGKVVYER